jgi:AcrR family transcriptional regulator
MPTTPSSERRNPTPARERLLAAAAEVFARDGIEGATTRAIAKAAGVNEVTLFRHFKSKDRLLAAVVGRNFGPSANQDAYVIPEPTEDLHADLRGLAECLDRMVADNISLVRTMIAETQRYQEHERQVFGSIFHPLKDALRTRFEMAKKAGELRADCEVDILGDLFVSMVFMGVMRRNMPHIRRHYSTTAYLNSVVAVSLHGALVPKASAS